MMQSSHGKRIATGLMLALGVLVGFVAGQLEQSYAQAPTQTQTPAETPPQVDLQLVTYASGLTGVFNPEEGRIYLYDSNLENCVAIRELGRLGGPMKIVK